MVESLLARWWTLPNDKSVDVLRNLGNLQAMVQLFWRLLQPVPLYCSHQYHYRDRRLQIQWLGESMRCNDIAHSVHSREWGAEWFMDIRQGRSFNFGDLGGLDSDRAHVLWAGLLPRVPQDWLTTSSRLAYASYAHWQIWANYNSQKCYSNYFRSKRNLNNSHYIITKEAKSRTSITVLICCFFTIYYS